MARPVRTVAVIAALAGAVFLFGPREVGRVLPAPDPAPVPAQAGRLVVDLVDGADARDLQAVEAVLGADLDWTHPLSVDEALAEGDVPDLDAAVAALAGHPLVEVAEPALELFALGYPNDPLYERQWHLREMGAPAGWASTPRGRGVVVAVIDTGVTRVEDLADTHVLEGASFVPGARTPADDNGHGTHVAGTIAQSTNNGVGAAGVAPEATILPIKVLSGFGGGMSSWIAAGIDHAADEGAQVINLSLGGSYSLVIHNAVRKARERGVVVVAAAGNSGRKGVSWPGALRETVGVSALGPGGGLAPYSSWGQGVDLAAPGGDKRAPGGGVLQNTVDRQGNEVYAEFQGTSMATPHVAGAAAVLLSTGSCDADCVEHVLLDAARGGDWDPKLGHGALDLGAAVARITDVHGGARFGLGLVLALLLAGLSGAGARFRIPAAFVGAASAGGLFFLPALSDALVVQLLSRGVLTWPGVLLGPSWVGFPLWLSAALPTVVVLTLGASRVTRPLALGLCAGVATHLLHGAATDTLSVWWMPGWLGTTWLAGNATVCLLLGMALAGVQKIEEGT